MIGLYVRFVLTSLTEYQSARSDHICQCLRKIMKVLVWIVWQCVPGRLIDNFTLLVTRPGTPLHMWNIELKILDFQHLHLQFTIQYEWISQLRNEIKQQGKMFIYSGGFWYLYQDQSQQERHKRDSQPRYREQARVKTPELREVRSECLQSAVCSV